MVSVIGLSPDYIDYCPKCGERGFPYMINGDGRMECYDCRFACYMVEAEDEE